MRDSRAVGIAGAVWGVVGPCLLLLSALMRLAPVAVQGFRAPLGLAGWLAAAGWVAFMAYFEGYKGFQRGFAPRVVARALTLVDRPRALHVALAPFFCMGYFHASRRRMITSWSVTLGVVALVMGVRHLGQPMRGIIDGGVVVGLCWGLLAISGFALKAMGGAAPDASADLPA